jgi:hypothetical protein
MGHPDALGTVKALDRWFDAKLAARDVRGPAATHGVERAARELRDELEHLASSIDLHRVIEDTLAMK